MTMEKSCYVSLKSLESSPPIFLKCLWQADDQGYLYSKASKHCRFCSLSLNLFAALYTALSAQVLKPSLHVNTALLGKAWQVN